VRPPDRRQNWKFEIWGTCVSEYTECSSGSSSAISSIGYSEGGSTLAICDSNWFQAALPQ
jgi:hypothetical protein